MPSPRCRDEPRPFAGRHEDLIVGYPESDAISLFGCCPDARRAPGGREAFRLRCRRLLRALRSDGASDGVALRLRCCLESNSVRLARRFRLDAERLMHNGGRSSAFGPRGRTMGSFRYRYNRSTSSAAEHATRRRSARCGATAASVRSPSRSLANGRSAPRAPAPAVMQPTATKNSTAHATSETAKRTTSDATSALETAIAKMTTATASGSARTLRNTRPPDLSASSAAPGEALARLDGEGGDRQGSRGDERSRCDRPFDGEQQGEPDDNRDR